MKKIPAAGSTQNSGEPGFWQSIKAACFGPARQFDWIQVEVTSRCPGGCLYCPRTALCTSWRPRDMDLSTFDRLQPLMRRSRRVHLQGWGEPLLSPVFIEMATLARRAGCQVSTTTCGLDMNEEIATALVESGIDVIAFSLAGSDAASNAVRGAEDFDRVCKAIDRLQAVRRRRVGVHLRIHLAYMLLASNLAAVRGLPALMQRLGVHAAVISTMDYLPDPRLAAHAFLPPDAARREEAAAVLAQTAAEARRLGLDFHGELPDPNAPSSCCRENIDRSLFVAADGSLSACVYRNVPADGAESRRRIFGNVNDCHPFAIWDSEDFRNFRGSLASGNPDPVCRSCPKRFAALRNPV